MDAPKQAAKPRAVDESNPASVVHLVKCPKCGAPFDPGPRSRTYCSRSCQRNATRGSRKAADSHAQRQINREDWSLLHWLNETYYGTRPDERLGLLKDWLDLARSSDTRLARALSKPEFFAPEAGDRRAFLRRNGKGCSAYPPVPLLADILCWWLLGRCRVWQWVNGTAPEPDSGEAIEAEAPPAYEVAA
jgi:hypothetical protein